MSTLLAPPTTLARRRSIDEVLAEARSRLDRLTPAEAVAAREAGAVVVDIRPAAQRAVQGGGVQRAGGDGDDADLHGVLLVVGGAPRSDGALWQRRACAVDLLSLAVARCERALSPSSPGLTQSRPGGASRPGAVAQSVRAADS